MLRTLPWMDTILYDPAKHLYRWSASYQDILGRRQVYRAKGGSLFAPIWRMNPAMSA
jgi:hypothetical protein